jgi:hypothetical protein
MPTLPPVKDRLKRNRPEGNIMKYMTMLLLMIGMLSVGTLSAQVAGQAHVPAKGSAEREAILDGLRSSGQEKFQVHFIKVHNGWAWVDTTPLDSRGKARAEGGPNLLHLVNGKWKVQDLSKVADDPNDPLGAEDASPTYVRNVRKAFKGCPADIFPKPSN